MTNLKKFFKDESGATAIEYGLLVALIAIAAIVGMGAVGTNLEALFQRGATELAV